MSSLLTLYGQLRINKPVAWLITAIPLKVLRTLSRNTLGYTEPEGQSNAGDPLAYRWPAPPDA